MDAQLITRLIVSILAVVNLICQQLGWTPFEADEEKIYSAVSLIFTIVIWARGFWKNNNFTQAAKLGQQVTDAAKARDRLEAIKYSEEDVKEIAEMAKNNTKEE